MADIPAKIGRGIVNVARRYGQEAADALLWLIKQGGDYVDEGVGAVDDKIDEIVDGAGDVAKKVVPDKAKRLANEIKARNGTPPPGYKGGRTYNNQPVNGGQKLPVGIDYKEYDVNPYVKGQGRGMERLVIGSDVPYGTPTIITTHLFGLNRGGKH